MRQLISYALAAALATMPWIVRPGASQVEEPAPVPVPEQQMPEPQAEENKPRRLQLNLTITSPEDLKVVEGQKIEVGQVLTDRTKERERLLAQKKQLKTARERLSIEPPKLTPPPPPPPVAQLPDAEYSSEVADIALVENTLENQELAVAIQKEKLETIYAIEGAPEIIAQHEAAVLAQKMSQRERVQLELEAKRSELEGAQADRDYLEYLHNLELERRAIQYSQQLEEYKRQSLVQVNQEREREYQKAAVQTKIQEVDNAIALLSQVRAPFSGEIKKVHWLTGNDNSLAVQLVIVPEGQRSAAESDLPGVRLPGNPNENEVSPLPRQQPVLPGNPDENSDQQFTGTAQN